MPRLTRDHYIQAAAHIVIAQRIAKGLGCPAPVEPEQVVEFTAGLDGHAWIAFAEEVEAEVRRLAMTHVEMARAALTEGVVK
jgi:hypothetical protein